MSKKTFHPKPLFFLLIMLIILVLILLLLSPKNIQKNISNSSKQTSDNSSTRSSFLDLFSASENENSSLFGNFTNLFQNEENSSDDRSFFTKLFSPSEKSIDNTGVEKIIPDQAYQESMNQIFRIHDLTPFENDCFSLKFDYYKDHFILKYKNLNDICQRDFQQWLVDHNLTNLPEDYIQVSP